MTNKVSFSPFKKLLLILEVSIWYLKFGVWNLTIDLDMAIEIDFFLSPSDRLLKWVQTNTTLLYHNLSILFMMQLSAFYDKALLDQTIKPTHISLFMALWRLWQANRAINPIHIYREEVMRLSKIASKATYHKCIRELHDKGYITYHPTRNPFKSSMVCIVLSDDS